MTRAWPSLLAGGALALLDGGCTITAVSAEQDTSVRNECASDDECSDSNCIDGTCQARGGSLEALLFEVTPPSDSLVLAHLQFLAHAEGLPTSGGRHPIELARVSQVQGFYKLGEDPPSCQPTLFKSDGSGQYLTSLDGTLPVTVSLSPSERLLGFSAQEYLTTTGNQPIEQGFTFSAAVPPGEYDVYVAPPLRQDPGCPIAPRLYRRQTISGSPAELNLSAAPQVQVTLEFLWPESSPKLDDWTVDIIEPLSGRAISSRFVLSEPALLGSGPGASLKYVVKLAYSGVLGGEVAETDAGNELVRLAPPEGVVAPAIFFVRAGLGLLSDTLVIDGFTKFPGAVTLEGQVADATTHRPAAGHVTLVSSEIEGVDSGVFAAFQQTVEVAADGRFAVRVPPGKYRVYAVPQSQAGLAAFETTWDVPGDIAYQAGKLLELPLAAVVTGTAFDSRSHQAMLGAQVNAIATPQVVLPFNQAFGAAAFVPRSATALVDGRGDFSVGTDPGAYDLSVRPGEASGFAWFVRPNVLIEPPGQDIGTIPLPVPVVITGDITVPGANMTTVPIPSAFIRAYAYLDAGHAYTAHRENAVSVVQVGETRADENGAFRLLLPKTIAKASP